MVELHPKGKNSEILAAEISGLLLSENVEVESYHYASIGIIETLVIAITGTVVSHLLEKVIDKLLFKEKENKIEIKITFTGNNITFKLPQEKEKCLKFINQKHE